MDTMEALLTRRSIRKYRPEPVPVEDLKEILAAGATAPSAVNMQHWYFVAVQDPAALEEVKAIMGGVVEKFQPVLEERFSRHPEQIGITNRFLSTLGGAPVCLLVFMLKPDYPDRDGAMQSVQLQLVIGRQLPKLLNVKGRKPCAAGNQDTLSCLAGT